MRVREHALAPLTDHKVAVPKNNYIICNIKQKVNSFFKKIYDDRNNRLPGSRKNFIYSGGNRRACNPPRRRDIGELQSEN